jgi:plastocyanin
MKRRALSGFGVCVLIMLWVISCAPNPLDASPVDTDRVEMVKSYRFAPVVIRIKPGTTVTWHNDDNFTHSIQLEQEGAKAVIVPPGQSTQLTFDNAGTFSYICSLHPKDMKGKIIVGSAAASSTSSYSGY